MRRGEPGVGSISLGLWKYPCHPRVSTHTEIIVVGQSSDSFREHGPHAVGRAERAARPAADAAQTLDESPPPSSGGPTALRGKALKRALAAIDEEKKAVESSGVHERAPEPVEPDVQVEQDTGPLTKRSR